MSPSTIQINTGRPTTARADSSWPRRARAAAGRVVRGVRRLLSAEHRRWARRMAEADRRVDGALGIQTGGLIDLVDLTTVGQNAGDGHPYSGTLPDEFERLMGLHPIDETRFTFVDLGSGMGRAVLLAAQRPFARCVGVEFAKELHAQALRNLASVKRGALACPVVEFVLGDALEYDLPDGPVAIYLYNPFNDRMQRRLVDRLVRAAREGGREIVVYQCNACWPQVWDGAEGVERVAADGVRMVHRVRAGG